MMLGGISGNPCLIYYCHSPGLKYPNIIIYTCNFTEIHLLELHNAHVPRCTYTKLTELNLAIYCRNGAAQVYTALTSYSIMTPKDS